MNTQECRDCAQAYNITAIPQFYFFVKGKIVNEFKGADQSKLSSAVFEISEMVKTRVSEHKTLSYQQFKPMNLAPQGFTTMGALDKIKDFVTAFAKSEEA